MSIVFKKSPVSRAFFEIKNHMFSNRKPQDCFITCYCKIYTFKPN